MAEHVIDLPGKKIEDKALLEALNVDEEGKFQIPNKFSNHKITNKFRQFNVFKY